jgi:outer membrane immunogenic protein
MHWRMPHAFDCQPVPMRWRPDVKGRRKTMNQNQLPMKKTLFALAFASIGLCALPAFAQDNQTAPQPMATSTTDSTTPNQNAAASGGNYQPSQAIGSGNWLIDASVGRTNGNSDGGFGSSGGDFNFLRGHRGRRTGYGVVGGYRWKVGQDLGLGVEAGYTDLGNFRVKNVFNSQAVNQRDSTNALRGWLVGVNGRINLTPQWYLGARGGYFNANDNSNSFNNSLGQDLGLTNGRRAQRGSWYAGVGTGWDINEHFGLGVHYDYFHANAGKIRNTATGMETTGLKRSTGMVSLTGEYRF